MSYNNPGCCRPYCTPNCGAVLDPCCMPERPKFPECYFNPFLHGQCLGINMNSERMRKEIQECQEEYKKKVWAILRKYAMGEDQAQDGKKNPNASKQTPTKQQKQKWQQVESEENDEGNEK